MSCYTCKKEINDVAKFKIYDNNNNNHIELCEKCFMDMVNAEEIYYCESHERFELGERKKMHKNGKIVDVCKSEYNRYLREGMNECRKCGILIYNDRGREILCSDCIKELNLVKISNRVEDYHASKNESPVFYGESANGIYFGYEIESEYKPKADSRFIVDLPKRVKQICNFERDGSLGNGFETITSPLSYEFMRNNNVIKEITDGLKENMRIKSTCGLHIHITKNDYTIGRLPYLLMFFENNKKDIEEFSQRKSQRYSKPYTGKDTLITVDDAKAIIDLKTLVSRYKNINITNSNTYEFRCFAGTLDDRRIIAYTQFLLTLLEMDIKEDTSFATVYDNISGEFEELKEVLEEMDCISGHMTLSI